MVVGDGSRARPRGTWVAEARPFARNLNNITAIVLQKEATTTTKEGVDVTTWLVADQSGSIRLSLFSDQGAVPIPSDIIRISGAYASLYRGVLTLYIGKTGSLERVGGFNMLFAEEPNLSQVTWEPVAGRPKEFTPMLNGAKVVLRVPEEH